MPYVTSFDSTRLYYEDSGSGTPIVFAHEFAGDLRSWEPQIRYFSRRNRCIAFCARGYPPSDIPQEPERYSQENARRDLMAVMDALAIERAHVVGHSMGSYTALHVGIRSPERCISIVATGCGFASNPSTREASLLQVEQNARMFAQEGIEAGAKKYASQQNRMAHKRKDPRGYAEFVARLAEHSAVGSSLTLLGVQRRRPSLREMEGALKTLVPPLLVITGDEDEDCVEAGVFLKQIVPRSALSVLPYTGHTTPLEEPAVFNQQLGEFFALVEAGRWSGGREPG